MTLTENFDEFFDGDVSNSFWHQILSPDILAKSETWQVPKSTLKHKLTENERTFEPHGLQLELSTRLTIKRLWLRIPPGARLFVYFPTLLQK